MIDRYMYNIQAEEIMVQTFITNWHRNTFKQAYKNTRDSRVFFEGF